MPVAPTCQSSPVSLASSFSPQVASQGEDWKDLPIEVVLDVEVDGEAGAGELVTDSSYPDYSVSVLSFNVNALNHKTSAVRLFLKAWDRAAEELNTNPESFRALLLKKIRVPKNIQKTYKIPTYPRRQVPNAAQWADVIDWMKANDLLDSALPYGDSVSDDYLPE